MLGGSKICVGLDIGSYCVKAVALQPNKGRLSLLGYAQARVEDQELSLVIRRVVEMLGVKAKNLVTAVSGRSVIVRQVETPKLQDNELKAHIAYEADKYIPFGAEEVVLDCQVLPPAEGTEESASNQQVLLVAVRRGFIEDHVGMLRGAGLLPSVIDVDVFALCNGFWTLGPNEPDEQGATALVDIGASKTWVAIVRKDRLLFQREIYLAGNEITDAIARSFNEETADVEAVKLNPEGDALDALIDAAMPAFEDLANEIRLSFDYVEGQFDQEVKRVVLTGGSSLLPKLPDILGNILSRPVLVFDPCGGLDLIPSKYDLHGLDANAPALTVAMGLACHLASDMRGLGGGQLQAWNPRHGASGGGAAKPADKPEERPEDEETMATIGVATPPPPSPTQAAARIQLATGAQKAPAGPIAFPSFPTPLPEDVPRPPTLGTSFPSVDVGSSTASVPELMPPPIARAKAVAAAEPPAAQEVDDAFAALDAEGQEAKESGSYDKDANRSSMLVILDDEDDNEMLGTEDRILPPKDKTKGSDEALPPLPQ